MTYTLSNNIYQGDSISRETETEMPNLVPFTLSVFITAFTGGWYLYDVYLKNKATEERVQELEETIDELNTRLEVHADTLHEQDQRIREKKNYDEADEVYEGIYQAWKGFYERRNPETNESDFEIKIQVWREKISTVGKNQEWVGWNEEYDTSCVVRDFYLGNSNPEFQWKCLEGTTFVAETSDIFINGWDSTIKLRVTVKAADKNKLVSFVSDKSFDTDKTMNKVLKECINEKRIKWSRVLIEVGCL